MVVTRASIRDSYIHQKEAVVILAFYVDYIKIPPINLRRWYPNQDYQVSDH